MEIVERPVHHPGVDIVTGSNAASRYIDTLAYTDYVDGRIYIADTTVQQMAEMLGIVAKPQLDDYSQGLLVTLYNSLDRLERAHSESLDHLRHMRGVLNARFGNDGMSSFEPTLAEEVRGHFTPLERTIFPVATEQPESHPETLGVDSGASDGIPGSGEGAPPADPGTSQSILSGNPEDGSDLERGTAEASGSDSGEESVGVQTGAGDDGIKSLNDF